MKNVRVARRRLRGVKRRRGARREGMRRCRDYRDRVALVEQLEPRWLLSGNPFYEATEPFDLTLYLENERLVLCRTAGGEEAHVGMLEWVLGQAVGQFDKGGGS